MTRRTLGLLLLILLATGCGTRYAGGELPELDDVRYRQSGMDATWEMETAADSRPAANVISSPRESFVERMIVESRLFASVDRGERGSADCHIRVIDRSWWRRSNWEVAGLLVTVVTVGIVPGYIRDEYNLEFVVTRGTAEKRYHYVDSVKEWWGIWGFLFPRDESFVVVPAGGDETWGESPTSRVLENMIRHFLTDLEADLFPDVGLSGGRGSATLVLHPAPPRPGAELRR